MSQLKSQKWTKSPRPPQSYPSALLQTTLTEPECRHLTPRTHWHHHKPRMGSVCAVEPRIIGQSGANGPVQTVWVIPRCDEAQRESSQGPPETPAVPSASTTASFYQTNSFEYVKESRTNKKMAKGTTRYTEWYIQTAYKYFNKYVHMFSVLFSLHC